MTTIRPSLGSTRHRAVLALAAVALIVAACNPSTPATPTPQGRSGAGAADDMALTTRR